MRIWAVSYRSPTPKCVVCSTSLHDSLGIVCLAREIAPGLLIPILQRCPFYRTFTKVRNKKGKKKKSDNNSLISAAPYQCCECDQPLIKCNALVLLGVVRGSQGGSLSLPVVIFKFTAVKYSNIT